MSTDSIEAIEYYWRPGCPFCMSLDRQLKKRDIARNDHNIWDDPSAAAAVREIANGNETVPTVKIGDVGLVNPSIDQLLEVLAQEAPHLVPDTPPSSGGLLGRLRGN